MARVSDKPSAANFTLFLEFIQHLDDRPWLVDYLARVDCDDCRSPVEDALESGADLEKGQLDEPL